MMVSGSPSADGPEQRELERRHVITVQVENYEQLLRATGFVDIKDAVAATLRYCHAQDLHETRVPESHAASDHLCFHVEGVALLRRMEQHHQQAPAATQAKDLQPRRQAAASSQAQKVGYQPDRLVSGSLGPRDDMLASAPQKVDVLEGWQQPQDPHQHGFMGQSPAAHEDTQEPRHADATVPNERQVAPPAADGGLLRGSHAPIEIQERVVDSRRELADAAARISALRCEVQHLVERGGQGTAPLEGLPSEARQLKELLTRAVVSLDEVDGSLDEEGFHAEVKQVRRGGLACLEMLQDLPAPLAEAQSPTCAAIAPAPGSGTELRRQGFEAANGSRSTLEQGYAIPPPPQQPALPTRQHHLPQNHHQQQQQQHQQQQPLVQAAHVHYQQQPRQQPRPRLQQRSRSRTYSAEEEYTYRPPSGPVSPPRSCPASRAGSLSALSQLPAAELVDATALAHQVMGSHRSCPPTHVAGSLHTAGSLAVSMTEALQSHTQRAMDSMKRHPAGRGPQQHLPHRR